MLIGLGHRKSTGKDTAAKIIQNFIKDYPVCRYAFADPLYKICRIMYGWAGFQPKFVYDDTPKLKAEVLREIGLTPREILIRVGNIVRDHVYKDTWLDYTINKCQSGHLNIITDVRYPNEADTIRAHGGILIRVDRPCVPHTNDVADVALIDYMAWDYIITNYDIKDFELDIKKTIKEIINERPDK